MLRSKIQTIPNKYLTCFRNLSPAKTIRLSSDGYFTDNPNDSVEDVYLFGNEDLLFYSKREIFLSIEGKATRPVIVQGPMLFLGTLEHEGLTRLKTICCYDMNTHRVI